MSKKGKGIIKIVKRGKKTVAALIHPWEMRTAKLEDTAIALKKLGDKKKPLHDDKEALEERHSEAVESVLNDWALFALGLIEAAHKGDHNAFRRIHDAIKNGRKYKQNPEIEALMMATTEQGRMPTADEIAKEMTFEGENFTATKKQQDVKRNLASLGFDVPSRPVGRPKKE
jgi:hypothetical protein